MDTNKHKLDSDFDPKAFAENEAKLKAIFGERTAGICPDLYIGSEKFLKRTKREWM